MGLGFFFKKCINSFKFKIRWRALVAATPNAVPMMVKFLFKMEKHIRYSLSLSIKFTSFVLFVLKLIRSRLVPVSAAPRFLDGAPSTQLHWPYDMTDRTSHIQHEKT